MERVNYLLLKHLPDVFVRGAEIVNVAVIKQVIQEPVDVTDN